MAGGGKEPEWREVADLARDLMLAREDADRGRGRAVFLRGAGCSVSSGIPAAMGVAKHCALHMANVYLAEAFDVGNPNGTATQRRPGCQKRWNGVLSQVR